MIIRLISFLLICSCLSPVSCFAEQGDSDTQKLQKLGSNGQYDEAIEFLLKRLEDKSQTNRSDLTMYLAGCYFNLGQYEDAERLVEKAIEYEYRKDLSFCPAAKYFNLGECLYFQRRFDKALTNYQKALEIIRNYHEPKLERRLCMSISSCYQSIGDLKKAAKFQEKTVRLDRMLYGDEDINYGWGLLKLSDLYRELKDKRWEPIFAKAIYIFRLVNSKRIKQECGVDEKAGVKLEIGKRIDKFVFGNKEGNKYSEVDSYLFDNQEEDLEKKVVIKCPPIAIWKNQYEAKEAPGVLWMEPRKPLKALVIAVHGLGLHHGAYESFAKTIAKEGFATISFDVRGFGTYLASKGSERLNMDACVLDLKRIVRAIRDDYPEKTIFLLGESMGGAIVMRLGAKYPELVDGIICSVPAGTRYEPAKTKVKVGFNFLKHKDELVDISPYVVNYATTNKELRKKWSKDPKSRLRLSPRELLDFNKFMNENPHFARQIKSLPVLLFQGSDDKLVKSKGTYDLFHSVESKDKTLVLVGGTEHLIFEAGQFRQGIALGVVGWMNAHRRSSRLSNLKE